MRLIAWIVAGVLLLCSVVRAEMHTYGGKDNIDKIHGYAVYFVPKGREPLADWKERLNYYARRIEAFHEREFAGQSKLTVEILPQPVIGKNAIAGYEFKDGDVTYNKITKESRAAVNLDRAKGFPVVIVFADINHCRYDDWERCCASENCKCEGHPDACRGNVERNGTEHPGSPCGGARAAYFENEHIGVGLVTADGWRVPVLGTDCVVYHEGIGHAIGLPHPEKNNANVMDLGQYFGPISASWLEIEQKKAMGWKEVPLNKATIFSALKVKHGPVRVKAGETFTITATVDKSVSAKDVRAEIQTPDWKWKKLTKPQIEEDDKNIRYKFTVPAFDKPTPVAYRVVARTERDETEIWGYARVMERKPEGK